MNRGSEGEQETTFPFMKVKIPFFNFSEKHDLPHTDWDSHHFSLFFAAIFPPLTFAFQKAYTRPSSLYIRKLGFVFSMLAGFQIGARKDRRNYNLWLMKNYRGFSDDFKLALHTGDARYIEKYDTIDLE